MKNLFRKDANLASYFKPALAALAGAVNTLAFAPFNMWWLSIASLAILILLTQSASSNKKAASFGFFYGLGWFGTGISWVHVAIADFGGLPIVASLLLMALLVAYLALFPALALYLHKRFQPRLGYWSLPFFWLVAETLRAHLLTGFPWLSLGYSQIEGPLRILAPIIGEVGLQAVVVLVGCIIVAFIKRQHTALAITGSIFIVGVALLTQSISWTSDINRTVRVALVQGNIEQSIKWQPENELPTMEKYLSMSNDFFDQHDIIFWPEAAIPRLEILANDFIRTLDRHAAETNTALITGVVDYQPDTDLAYNNLIVLGKKNADDEFGHYRYLHNNRFNKHHLLPIGEFVPFESVLRKLGPLFDLPMSSFSRGRYQQDNLIAQGLNISPAICFEIAFASQVRDNLYGNSDFILTVSNDAWFGNSHGPWQHLQIAQMRALEMAKPVIRVTNNGVTAVIGADGRIRQQLPQFEAAVLSHTLPILTSNTPYRALGNLPAWLIAISLILLGVGAKWLAPASGLNRQN